MGTSYRITIRAGHRSMAFCGYLVRPISRGARWSRVIATAAAAAWSNARLPGTLQIRTFAGALLTAFMLTGCGADGVGTLLVDPARYDGYNCKDLVGQWNGLVAREKQLRNLIDKADASASGVVIGAVAYRGDYQTVLQQKRVLQRAAAEKKCQLTPPPAAFTSDLTIR